MSTVAPDAIFDEVAAELLQLPGVTVGRSLSDGNLMVNSKIFAFLKKSSLVVKMPADRVATLESDGDAVRFSTSRGPMREWAVIESTALWPGLMREALEFVASLPPGKVKNTRG